jgi:hypothetical protein
LPDTQQQTLVAVQRDRVETIDSIDWSQRQ